MAQPLFFITCATSATALSNCLFQSASKNPQGFSNGYVADQVDLCPQLPMVVAHSCP